MKMSAYQFMCVCDSTAIIDEKLKILVFHYASTRDFNGFEQYNFGDYQSLGLSISFDLKLNVGACYQWNNKDTDLEPITIWNCDERIYVGLMFSGQFPIIIEILPNSVFVRVFYSDQHYDLQGFVKSFKDRYDFDMQRALFNATTRLNINIALGDIDAPDVPYCIY